MSNLVKKIKRYRFKRKEEKMTYYVDIPSEVYEKIKRWTTKYGVTDRALVKAIVDFGLTALDNEEIGNQLTVSDGYENKSIVATIVESAKKEKEDG